METERCMNGRRARRWCRQARCRPKQMRRRARAISFFRTGPRRRRILVSGRFRRSSRSQMSVEKPVQSMLFTIAILALKIQSGKHDEVAPPKGGPFARESMHGRTMD
jgi:hypothetical protein